MRRLVEGERSALLRSFREKHPGHLGYLSAFALRAAFALECVLTNVLVALEHLAAFATSVLVSWHEPSPMGKLSCMVEIPGTPLH